MIGDIQKYKVKTPVFEGPMELLLDLVEERKLFINEISLAQVTDDYIQHIKELEIGGAMDIGELTGFLAVAATLILIKSKSLLPTLTLTENEQGQIDDLEERLRLYQIYKNISVLLNQNFGKQIIFSRAEVDYSEPVFSPDQKITTRQMIVSIKEVISNIPKKEFLPEVAIKKVISIEEMIGSLIDRVQTNLKLSFHEFSKSSSACNHKEQKVYVIVGFLAMLELVRAGTLSVMQQNNFEDIIIEKI